MSVNKYRVFLRNAQYQLVDEITDYLSLTAIKRFNDVGTWTLELPSAHMLVPLITRRSGIVIKRDDVTIFSGSIGSEMRATALSFTMSGYDDNVILEEPCRPTPSNASGPYPDDYHVLIGAASTVLREIVNANVGPGAPVGCRLDNLALGTDPLIGGSVVFRGNFQTMLAAMQEIAVTPVAGGLGFEVVQSDTLANTIELRIYAPQVRTEAIFSVNLNTASDYDDVWEFPEANYWVVLGGDGFGASTRTVVEASDGAALAEVGRRITGVYVANGVTDASELNQKLAELLAGSVSLRKTTIQPFEVATLEFGEDWDFGDIVTVVVNGEEFPQVIREVSLDFTADQGVVVTPMIGDPNADNDDRLARHVKSLKDRMTNIELNWRVPPDSIDANMLVADSVGASELQDAAVAPTNLIADTPTDDDVLSYDGGDFIWRSFAEVFPGMVDHLTVAHDTILGIDGTDGLTVNATATFNGNVDLPVLFLDAANNRAYFGATAGLTGADDDVVDIVGGALHIASSTTGGTPHTVLGFRYGTAGTTFGILIDAATDPVLQFVDDGGSVVFRVQDSSDTYQAQVVGKLNVTGDVIGSADAYFSSQLAVGALAFSSTETLRVVGSSRLEGGVDITTGGLGVSGSGLFRDALTVQDGLTVQTGNFEVSSGDSLMDGDLHVTGSVTVDGGIAVSGFSPFSAGISVAGGDLDVLTYVDHSNGSASSATISNWDGYVQMKFGGSIKKFYYKD